MNKKQVEITPWDVFLANWDLSFSKRSYHLYLILMTAIITVCTAFILREESFFYILTLLTLLTYGFLSILALLVTVFLSVISCILSYFVGSYRQTGMEINDSEIIEHYQDGKRKIIPIDKIRKILIKGDRAYFTSAAFRTVILSAREFDSKSDFLSAIGQIVNGAKNAKVI